MKGTFRLCVVNPNSTASMTESVVQASRSVAQVGTVIEGLTCKDSVPSVETPADEVIAARCVLEEIESSVRRGDGPDAYVVACFGDTGVWGARYSSPGPVIGITEAALATAAMIAQRFTIITMPRNTLEQSARVVRQMGLEHRCQIRAVDEPVASIAHSSLHLFDAFFAEAKEALLNEHSEAIIVGCAGLADLVRPLRTALGVPVIDGVAAAVTVAEGLWAQGLTTSRANTWSRRGDTLPFLEKKK